MSQEPFHGVFVLGSVGRWAEGGYKNPSVGTSREQGEVSTGSLSRSKVTRSPDVPETEGFPGT